MSLPVGTLVMLINSGDQSGMVGTIVAPLTIHQNCVCGPAACYGVDFPRNPSYWPGGDGLPRGAWCVAPEHLVPIIPPGQTDDVTTDEPIEEIA